jgi:hypothetical protein
MKRRNMEPLTRTFIESVAPSVYATKPSNNVSDKYTFIPTTQIVDDLGKGGWQIYSASQRNSRSNAIFAKHMLRFRNDDIPMVDGIVPEIVLTNSHDGRNAFNLHAGLFRLVCSNGLVVADQTFEKVKIKHQWYNLEDIQKITDNVITSVPKIMGHVDDFKKTIMSPAARADFAKKAILTRWKDGQEFIPITEILSPNRSEDQGDRLWEVFNVVQEKIIRGGITYYLNSGRQQTVRELTNIDQRLNINKKLWSLAEEYVS